MITPTRVLLAGGGSAGHVEPALATADALRRGNPDCQVTLLGTRRGLETRLVPARGYPLELIPAVPMPRRLTFDLAVLPPRLLAAVRAAHRVIRRSGAEVVAGFGGYVALPAYLAARAAGVPIVVHEANARPGWANRVGARLTPFVAAATDATNLPGAVRIGMPLRVQVAELDRAATRGKARAHFGLDPQAPALFVFGGSQGARRLNEAVVAAAPGLRAAGIQVLHLSGPAHAEEVRASLASHQSGPAYVVIDYLDRMELGYAAADLALCRAGAMTCAELAAVGLPAVYVPLPIGNGEQRRNAAGVVAAGGGLLVADRELTGAWLTATVPALVGEPSRLAAMSAAASRFGIRDGDLRLAELIARAGAR